MGNQPIAVEPAEVAVVTDNAGVPMGRALIASHDPRGHEDFVRVLRRCGLQPVQASTLTQARELLLHDRFSMILCEETIAGGSYRDILQRVGGFAARIPVVVFSRIADWDRYLEAMRAGAFDYVADPCSAVEIESVVKRALRVVPLFPIS